MNKYFLYVLKFKQKTLWNLFDGPQVRPAARLHRPQPADFWRAGPIPTLADM